LGRRGLKRIENSNFLPIIKASEETKGFEANHKIADVKVGYDEKSVMKKVDDVIDKIKNKKIKHLLVVGLLNHAAVHSQYFYELEENLPEDYFVISTLIPSTKKNILYLNQSYMLSFLSIKRRKVAAFSLLN
jgi:hydroxylamine reductase